MTITTRPFVIEPMTGEIILNFDPQINQKGYFDFTVKVRDIGNYDDYAQVYIYLSISIPTINYIYIYLYL